MIPVRLKRVVAAVSALALTGGLLQLGGSVAAAKSTTFSPAAEAKKMDAIATPKLGWYACYGYAECATVKVPRDYDRPKGAQVELALLRVKARDQKHRIGSLFVNPGGPGGSATDLAYFSSEIFSPAITNRFDVVGLDPRGIAFSQNVTCFSSARAQAPALVPHQTSSFPITRAQEKAWLKADRAEGKACSTTALAKSMSTAEVARDMELMRRAVGDKKLSYIGFSYGSYLGQVYANMFPNRFRSLVIDGVIDPLAWAGTPGNQRQPLELRLRSSVGAWKAMRDILVRCDQAGGSVCSFAPGDPVANFALIAHRLRTHPMVEVDPFTGATYTFGYSDFVGLMLGLLYDPAGYEYITEFLSELIIITEPPAKTAAAAQAAKKTDAKAEFAQLRRATKDRVTPPRFGFPYDNSLDAFASVTCTDSTETTKQANFPAFAAQADQRAPYFGRAWLWGTSVCAGDAFTGNDEDAFTGPFTQRTAATVLVVGNYWDPATNYDGAKHAAALLPNSRLLSSNSWGHTAYATQSSACVTSAVDAYLLKGTVPAKGKVCQGDIQPFRSDPEQLSVNAARQQALRQRLTTGATLTR
ncbi:MAG: alpha/beta hydrolase [Propionibacteriaceae bacterium]